MSIFDITIDDGVVTVPIRMLLERARDADLVGFLDDLSTREAVIKHVADQIVAGCTDQGSWGARGVDVAMPTTALDVAQRRIAEMSSEIARDEIARLVGMVEARDKTIVELNEKLDRWRR